MLAFPHRPPPFFLVIIPEAFDIGCNILLTNDKMSFGFSVYQGDVINTQFAKVHKTIFFFVSTAYLPKKYGTPECINIRRAPCIFASDLRDPCRHYPS